MNHRIILGKTGISVSRVCFGTWQLSPRFWGEVPASDVKTAVHSAYELGINFFDTADAYGDGYGESVLGDAVRDFPRDRVVLTTKVFNHYNPDGTRYPDLSPGHIVERCEASLKRLRTDYIDLYLLHFYDQLTPLATVAETLEKLKSQGKIRHYGMSNFNIEEMRAAAAFGNFEVLEPAYSLVNLEAEQSLFPYCQARGIGVMVYSPLHKGLLTGKYKGTESFSDFRKFHPDFQGERFRLLAEAVQSLAPIAARYGLSIYQLVLAATIEHPAVHSAIAGIKTSEQVREAAGAMGKRIDRPDYFKIRQILNVSAPAKIQDAGGKVK
ncbi:MAG: aldo/keto reductase [Acidobacteriota bacterium]|nr:aldo/keto reductase [Acidobacteriota bacterium]